MRAFVIFLFFLFVIGGCQSDAKTAKKVNLYNTAKDLVGTADLSENPDGVKIKLKVEGLTPGFHGIHVHEFGKCEGPDFQSAGNHLNPEGKEHGLMHPDGAHLGDLPNVEADPSGLVEAEIVLSDATLLEGKKSIVEGDGTALIITEEQDDGVSQPSGEAGSRLICGVISDEKEPNESPTDPTETNEDEE